ncbi:unnamed protein product [Meloidogyne enterolobii]|uniref:Uncharacterized protein n=1 Tax=Meloidogyne enterolobii TaxID=390850 RepID=A0ACB0YFV2_MELEN
MAEEKINKISEKEDEEEEYLILEEEEEQPLPQPLPQPQSQQQQKILLQKLLSNKPSIPDSKKRILVPPPPLLLKKSMRAHSDLENLLKAGQQIAKRDPGFRRLITGAGSPKSLLKHHYYSPPVSGLGCYFNPIIGEVCSTPLNIIRERHRRKNHFFDGMPKRKDEENNKISAVFGINEEEKEEKEGEIRSRSDTIESGNSSINLNKRKQKCRGASVCELEIVQILANSCENCRSLMFLHNGNNNKGVSF